MMPISSIWRITSILRSFSISNTIINTVNLPTKFNKDNAPKPSNSEIQILTIEGGYYAVIKYSGRSSDQNFLKNKEILDKELKQDNITILSS